jgi:type IV pilus assembly protein PilB
METVTKRLGEYLLEKGIINADQLNQALILASERNQRIGEVLVDLGFINLRQLTDAILEQQKIHMPDRKRLGEILLESKIITEEQLSEGLKEQKNRRQKIGQILVSLGYVTKEQIANALSEKLNIPIIPCEKIEIDTELKNIIPKNIAEKYNIIPIKKEENVLTIAMADPLDYKAIDDISFMTRLKINTLMAYEWAIHKAIEQNYKTDEPENVFDELRTEINVDKEIQFKEEKEVEDMNVEVLYTKSKAPTVVKLVAMIVAEANKARASDIHIEPMENSVIVRFRVDGELRKVFKYSKDLHDSVISRIKIISKLDITNRRVPQDGGVRVSLRGKEIDLRVSTLPSIYGEKVVMRLLDQSYGITNIEEIAMPDSIKIPLLNILHSSQGMLIVTGPTGSGKTTTLYACLHEIKSITKNIITIEDPVEYKIDGIIQTQVNETVGRTFASILRAVLRQDPDIIMVGEIRDLETAEIAIKASLTGHLVLTTLHTNNTIATITRLIDIGIPPYLVSSAVSGVLAQRLVRRICIYCKVQVETSDELKEKINAVGLPMLTKHYIGTGCPKCLNTGYSGRLAIYEFLPMSRSIRRLVSKNADEDQLFSEAKNAGVTYLFEDAWNKVRHGITTVDEVMAKIPMDYGIKE